MGQKAQGGFEVLLTNDYVSELNCSCSQAFMGVFRILEVLSLDFAGLREICPLQRGGTAKWQCIG